MRETTGGIEEQSNSSCIASLWSVVGAQIIVERISFTGGYTAGSYSKLSTLKKGYSKKATQ